jgi:GTP-binding protein
VGDRIRVLQHGTSQLVDDLRITRIEKRVGMERVQLQQAVSGDVVSLAGAGDAAGIADTIAAPVVTKGLDPGPIDPPTLRWAWRALVG